MLQEEFKKVEEMVEHFKAYMETKVTQVKLGVAEKMSKLIATLIAMMFDGSGPQRQQQKFMGQTGGDICGEKSAANAALIVGTILQPSHRSGQVLLPVEQPGERNIGDRLMIDPRRQQRCFDAVRRKARYVRDLKPREQPRETAGCLRIVRLEVEKERQARSRRIWIAALLLDDRKIEIQIRITPVERNCLLERRSGSIEIANLCEAYSCVGARLFG